MSKDEFSDYYKKSEVTDSYDSQRLQTAYRRGKREKEMKIFLDLLDVRPEDKTLECGCSSGFLTQYLGNNVVAIDFSEKMIALAKQKHPKAKFFCQDMFEIPIIGGKKTFDKIVSKRVMTHLLPRELSKFFNKVNETLNDNGIFVFDVEERCLIRRIIRPIYTKIFNVTGWKTYQHSVESISKILEETGFAVMEIRFLKHRLNGLLGRQIMIKAKKV